jgi:hypothetical protein
VRRVVPRIAAAVVAVLGLATLVTAAVVTAQGSGRETVVGRLPTATARIPVITTMPGVLEVIGPQVQIRATTKGSAAPVFLGVGRAADVQAYLAKVSRTEITGVDADRRLTGRPAGSEPALPNPTQVDVWALTAQGTGSAELTWPDQPGRWQLVVASDGTAAAPAQFTLSWSRPRTGFGGVPVLVAIGAALLVGGTTALVGLQWRRPRRPERPHGRRAARAYPYADDPEQRLAPVDGETDRAGPVADPPTEDLFVPHLAAPPLGSSTGGSDQEPTAGVIDRRMAAPGLRPDHPTTQLRRIRVSDPRPERSERTFEQPAPDPGRPDPPADPLSAPLEDPLADPRADSPAEPPARSSAVRWRRGES